MHFQVASHKITRVENDSARVQVRSKWGIIEHWLQVPQISMVHAHGDWQGISSLSITCTQSLGRYSVVTASRCSDSALLASQFETHISKQQPSNHCSTMRSRDNEEPNVTRWRLLHSRKQQLHNSRTLSGMLTHSTPVQWKQEIPIRSTDDDPNVTQRRLSHSGKQLSHNSRTESGMLASSTQRTSKQQILFQWI